MKNFLAFLLSIGVLILSGASAAFGYYLRYDSAFQWGPFAGFILLLVATITAGWGTFLLWKTLGNFPATEGERTKITFLVAPILLLNIFVLFNLIIIPHFHFFD